MTYIVFDLEWNMGYPKNPSQKLNEIVEIGAVKVEDFDRITGVYSRFIKPTVHHSLHHHIRKKLPFTIEQLKASEPFGTVIEEFRNWCGEDAVFVSWGPSDMIALQENLSYFGMDDSWAQEAWDLQAALGYLMEDYNRQMSLESACDQFEVAAEGEFHDAGTDAKCTALVGIAMKKRYGYIPSWQTICEKKEQLRKERAKEVAEKLRQDCLELMSSSARYEEAVFGTYSSKKDCFKDRVINRVVCPECGVRLGCGEWLEFSEGYLSRTSCPEHGKFYPILQFEGEQGALSARRFVLGNTPKTKTVYFRVLDKLHPAKKTKTKPRKDSAVKKIRQQRNG